MTQDTKRHQDEQGQQRVPTRIEDSDDLQFEVSEAHNSGSEFVGGKKGFTGGPAEELGVESPADLLKSENAPSPDKPTSQDDQLELTHDFGGEIEGFTSNSHEDHTSSHPAQKSTAPLPPSSAPRPTETARIRQLSDNELKQIEQNLYGASPKISDRDKGELLSKLSKLNGETATATMAPPSQKATPSPSISPKSSTVAPNDHIEDAPPAVARRARGIAYFYKNWVQIVTSYPLHADDEIVMGDRAYILRPKKLSGSTKMTLGAILGGIAILITAMVMVSGNGTGAGSIIGMVLDADGKPFIQGAVIQITESGLRTESNGIGMFRLDDVPKGSHKLDIAVAGKVVGSDFATATDNDLTMTVLRVTPASQPKATTEQAESFSQPPSTASNGKTQVENVSASSVPERKQEAPARATTSPAPAKLVLESNVEGARLIIDGKVLGAGNNTYTSISAGEHTYQVSRDGYKPSTGTVRLVGGQTKTLSVQLDPVTISANAATSELKFFQSGGAKMQAGDYSGAIANYTQAVEAKPSYADAYLMRAEAYRAVKDPKSAHDDYIRAAEIYRFRRDPASAQTSFAKAIEVDSRSLAAYLGRADLFLTQGQEIAALADYEAAVRLDKRSFEAHFGLGRCRFDQGNYKQAERHFKDARDLDRQKTASYEYLMICYQQMDQLKDLKKTWEQYRGIADQADITRLRSDARFAAAIRTAESQ
ncbi:MAG: tetratricopeptide repeat protein [Candidatus Zixiibacteriota bacterium]